MGRRGHEVGHLRVPESELNVYGDVSGLDVLDLGCGTAYLSAWLAKRGARPVAVDPTPAQLETAREMQKEFGLEFAHRGRRRGRAAPRCLVRSRRVGIRRLHLGRPLRWIPEAARLLRPGGRLVFLRNSTLATLCCTSKDNVTERLQRPQRGMNRVEWENIGRGGGPASTRRAHRLAGESGFEIERLIGLCARGCGDARVLRLRHARLGAEVAGGGDLGPRKRS